MEISNKKEKEFFELLRANGFLQDRKVENKEIFVFTASYLMHEQSGVLSELLTEIDDNLLQLSSKDARSIYLKKYLTKTENLATFLSEQIVYYKAITDDTVLWQVNWPDKRIHFEIEPWRLENVYKTGLGYLNLLKANVEFHLELESINGPQPASGADASVKIKWVVSKEQCYDVFKKLHSAGWLENNTDDLAAFIHSNFTFSKGKHPTKSTISSELRRKNKKPYKGKGFNLPDTK